MSSDWTQTTLGEFAEINPPRSLRKGEKAPFISMADLGYGRDIETSNLVIRVYNGGGTRFKNGDTLLARITPSLENGKTALVSGFAPDQVCHGSTEFIVLGPRRASDSLFLYYLARNPTFRAYAIQSMEGSTGRQRVPARAVAAYRFLCPPPKERERIARVLGNLDDRIALLRETRSTLESIAEAIFKSWFVDFEPVYAKAAGHEPHGMDAETAALFPSGFEETDQGRIPRGWRRVSLGNVAIVSSGRRPEHYGAARSSEEDVPIYGAGGPMGWTCKPLTSGPVIVTGRVGTLGRIFLVSRPCWPSDNTLVISAENDMLVFLYFALRRINLAHLNRGSSQPLLTQKDLRAIPLTVPNEGLLASYGRLVRPLFARSHHSESMAETLAMLRDTLLPRLFSGKLCIAEAIEMVQEASS